jgi:hypothetical protein
MNNGHESKLIFPTKEKPDNLFVTPNELGNFESFEELFKKFPPMLSVTNLLLCRTDGRKKKRQEAKQKGESTVSVLDDEIQRDKFLVKMMYILMVKRLESSCFHYTHRFKNEAHHQNALKKSNFTRKIERTQQLTMLRLTSLMMKNLMMK